MCATGSDIPPFIITMEKNILYEPKISRVLKVQEVFTQFIYRQTVYGGRISSFHSILAAFFFSPTKGEKSIFG